MQPLTFPPSVSIIIPCLNEEGFITPCITSLIDDSYPKDKIELLVVDGGSTDSTLKEVQELGDRFDNVRILHNPKQITPAAMNIGITASSNEIIIWCGAHARYQKDYILNSVKTLIETNCASAGGVITPIAHSEMGKAIAIATTSRFGIGNAKYRYAKQRQQVDTVFGGCFAKSSVTKIGGFDESWIRNQDSEFNYRLRLNVGPIVLDPSIQCEYYCRETLSSLSKQYFQYGYWRCKTAIKHPDSMSFRQIIPIALNLGLLCSIALSLSDTPYRTLGALIPILYLVANIVASAQLARLNNKMWLALRLPAIFASIHISWGAGFLFSATKHCWDKIRPARLNN